MGHFGLRGTLIWFFISALLGAPFVLIGRIRLKDYFDTSDPFLKNHKIFMTCLHTQTCTSLPPDAFCQCRNNWGRISSPRSSTFGFFHEFFPTLAPASFQGSSWAPCYCAHACSRFCPKFFWVLELMSSSWCEFTVSYREWHSMLCALSPARVCLGVLRRFLISTLGRK